MSGYGCLIWFVDALVERNERSSLNHLGHFDDATILKGQSTDGFWVVGNECQAGTVDRTSIPTLYSD